MATASTKKKMPPTTLNIVVDGDRIDNVEVSPESTIEVDSTGKATVTLVLDSKQAHKLRHQLSQLFRQRQSKGLVT